MQIVNCGHPPPLRLPPTGATRPLSPQVAASPLGLDPHLHVDVYAVAPGDRVLLYTDGLLEARDSAGAFFPLPEHLPGLAAEHDLDRHTGGSLDDEVAVLLARAEPVDHPGPAHGPRTRPSRP